MRLESANTRTIRTVSNSGGTINFAPVRGPQGLPGPGAAAWTADTAVTTDAVRQAPDGSWIKSLGNRTTRASFDATEETFWVAVAAATGTVEERALTASYARTGFVVQSAALTNGTDQAATINAELAALPATGATLVLPEGDVTVASALTIPSYTVIQGAGRGSQLRFTGTGTLVTLTSKTQVKFRNLRVHLTLADQIAFDLSNSFRCSWTGCIIEGEHVTTAATYRGQIGIKLRDNAGDNRIIDCDLNNLGIGISTDAVATYVVGSVFGVCWRSIVGGDPTGAVFLASLSVNSCTFVGSPTAAVTDTHVLINGSAADWAFVQCWFEKADNAVIVGTGAYGPRSFTLRDALMLSGRDKCLEINAGRQPVLDAITFGDEDGTETPVELLIDGTDAPAGVAIGLRPRQVFDFADSVFPAGWTVLGNRTGAGKVARFLQAENWKATTLVSSPTSGNTNFGASAALDTTYLLGMYRVSTGAQNAEVSWDVDLSAGTWTIQLGHKRDTNRGIYTILVDSVSVGTIDGYNGTVDLRIDSVTGVTIATGGKHQVTLKMATKNASSSSYYGTPSFLDFTRTA